MADMVKGVKVYSDEMEVLDYINENMPPELKSMALKLMDENRGVDVIFPFHFADENRKYYAVLIKLGEVDDEGSLLLLISKERESIYNYVDNVIANSPEEYKKSLESSKGIILQAFEEIDKHINQ